MVGFLQPALFIFLLRMVDVSLYTMRILMVVRGRKAWAWVFAFFQSATYVVSLRVVLSNLGEPLNLLGYAAGFATGLVIGILIENRLALGHLHLRVISAKHGLEIASQLRNSGFAVTEIPCHGRDGMVSLLSCNVMRKHLDEVHEIVSRLDDKAFMTAENVYPVQRGFWRA